MATFQRLVRDVVADTVTTNTLFSQTATIKTLTATTVDATTVNTTAINLPNVTIFVTDDNAVFGGPNGALFTFQRTGNVVVAQIDLEDSSPLVASTNFLQFTIPAPYAPTGLQPDVSPIAMCINNGGSFFGFALIGGGVIQIAPSMGGVFTAGDQAAIFPATFTYIIN